MDSRAALIACLTGPRPADAAPVYSRAQAVIGTPQLDASEKKGVLAAVRTCAWLTKKQRGSLERLAEHAETVRQSWADGCSDGDEGNGCPSDIDEDYWEEHNED